MITLQRLAWKPTRVYVAVAMYHIVLARCYHGDTNIYHIIRRQAHYQQPPSMITESTLTRMYVHGPRCPELLHQIVSMRGYELSNSTIRSIAGFVFALWELDSNGNLITAAAATTCTSNRAMCGTEGERRTRFVHYLGQLLRRLQPHPISVLMATLLVHRLRLAHPQARGEPGCSHRLIVVSLMLAMKYVELDAELIASCGYTFIIQNPGLESTESWAATSAIFSAAELHKMEAELAGFLACDLYVGIDELAYWSQNEFGEERRVSHQTAWWLSLCNNSERTINPAGKRRNSDHVPMLFTSTMTMAEH